MQTQFTTSFSHQAQFNLNLKLKKDIQKQILFLNYTPHGL